MSNTRLVILFLGAIVLVSLAGIIALTLYDHSIPDVLVATTSGGVASLGTLLVNARGSESGDGTPPAPGP